MDVDAIRLDNMTPHEMRRAVELRDRMHPDGRTHLEASGGITVENANAIVQDLLRRRK
jgi:nicotinate-nucleotide pyrophosphorylase